MIRNYKFYKRVSEELDMILEPSIQIEFDPNGLKPLEAFTEWECRGNKVPCKNVDLLNKVLQAKAYINLLIKMWAEGIAERLFWIEEFQNDFPWFPDWVWKAVTNQAKKRHNELLLSGLF